MRLLYFSAISVDLVWVQKLWIHNIRKQWRNSGREPLKCRKQRLPAFYSDMRKGEERWAEKRWENMVRVIRICERLIFRPKLIERQQRFSTLQNQNLDDKIIKKTFSDEEIDRNRRSFRVLFELLLLALSYWNLKSSPVLMQPLIPTAILCLNYREEMRTKMFFNKRNKNNECAIQWSALWNDILRLSMTIYT